MDTSEITFPIQATLCFCIEQATRHGFDLGAVLAGSGLDNKTYVQPTTVLSQKQEFTIYANILRLFAADDVGLTLGGKVNVNNVGLLGGLTANAIDVAHAGYLMRRFHALSIRWFTPELIGELTPGKSIVRYRQVADLGPLYQMLIDISIRGAQQGLIDVFGAAAGAFVSAIAFGYPAPRNADRYAAEFACPISFGHDFTFVTFDNEVGKLVNHNRSEFTYRVFLQHCRDSVFRYGALSWQQRVLNILACVDHYPSAETMAEKLNCSERSLRRHLGSEGVQYSELIDRIRFDRAVYLLRHSSDSVKKIGYQLSYSEPGAFIRAFSRWADVTPTEFRRAIARLQ